MRRIFAALLVVLLACSAVTIVQAEQEATDDSYLLLGIPYGTSIWLAKIELEKQLGVDFVQDFRWEDRTEIVAEHPVELYGHPTSVRFVFRDGQGMDEVVLAIGFESNEKTYIELSIGDSVEELSDDIDAQIDELARIHSMFTEEYGFPTGGNLCEWGENDDRVLYNYPLKDGKPNFDVLKAMSKEGVSLIHISWWGDLCLELRATVRVRADLEGAFAFRTSARVSKYLNAQEEVKIGFEEENGEYPLGMTETIPD